MKTAVFAATLLLLGAGVGYASNIDTTSRSSREYRSVDRARVAKVAQLKLTSYTPPPKEEPHRGCWWDDNGFGHGWCDFPDTLINCDNRPKNCRCTPFCDSWGNPEFTQ